jgi:hypothetical protein
MCIILIYLLAPYYTVDVPFDDLEALIPVVGTRSHRRM